ncbi:MAG: lysine exporter LysO family protein [Peptostreptococcaceae bacterium]|nr:lysine exporter LysO family protein [Peptostreptococcaceae bacterium]
MAIGFSLGLNGNIFESLKRIGFKFLIFPLAAIIGSLVGGAICGLFLPITIPEGLAIGAGFGWYTMAPTIITEAGHTYAGAISFMHNVIREMGGIVLIPFLANKIGYIEVTAIPGVCAMDIGMPIIEKCTKEEMVAYSFGMGLIMSMVVPMLVPILINI